MKPKEYECNGEKHTMKEWAEISGINVNTLRDRVRNQHMSLGEAMTRGKLTGKMHKPDSELTPEELANRKYYRMKRESCKSSPSEQLGREIEAAHGWNPLKPSDFSRPDYRTTKQRLADRDVELEEAERNFQGRKRLLKCGIWPGHEPALIHGARCSSGVRFWI